MAFITVKIITGPDKIPVEFIMAWDYQPGARLALVILITCPVGAAEFRIRYPSALLLCNYIFHDLK